MGAAKILVAMAAASSAVVFPGAASAAQQESLSCSATIEGNDYLLSWNDVGVETYYIRHNGDFLRKVQETHASASASGTYEVRAWIKGKLVAARCFNDDVEPDWTQSCKTSGDGSQIVWDKPELTDDDLRYYIRQNGVYVATVTGHRAFSVAGLETGENLVVRYWHGRRPIDAECEVAVVPANDFEVVAFPDGYRRTADNADNRGGGLYSTFRASFLMLSHYSGSTHDYNSLVVYNGRDDLLVVGPNMPEGDLVARNSLSGYSVYASREPGSEGRMTVHENGAVSVFQTESGADGLNVGTEGVITENDYVVTNGGGNLSFMDLETGEYGLLKNFNGSADANPHDLSVLGDEVTAVITVGSRQVLIAINPETKAHRIVSGSWADWDQVIAATRGQESQVASWIADEGSSAILRTSEGVSVEVSSVSVSKAQIVSNGDGVLFVAVQPEVAGSETVFMSIDSHTGAKTVLGEMQTHWLGSNGVLSLGIVVNDMLVLVDEDNDGQDTLWLVKS